MNHAYYCLMATSFAAKAWKRGAGYFTNKNVTRSEEQFFSIKERRARIIMKLKNSCKSKLLQTNVPTTTHSYEEVEQFYEDMEGAMKKNKTHFSRFMGDFNANVETKNDGKTAVGLVGTGTRNRREDQFVELAKKTRLRITNPFFLKSV